MGRVTRIPGPFGGGSKLSGISTSGLTSGAPMATARTLRSSLLRGLGGFVTLVAGVLLALAADAWWQGHEAQARTRVYLQMLRTDLHETADHIDRGLAFDSTAALNAAVMANALLVADSWEAVPATVTPYFEYDGTWFRMGTMTALLSTGDINNIRSDSLRSAIVRLTGKLEDLQVKLNATQTAIWSNVADYTRAERTLFESTDDRSTRRRLTQLAPADALRLFDLAAIRRYPEIQASFRLHAIAVANRSGFLQDARAPVDSIIDLLDRELGREGKE